VLFLAEANVEIVSKETLAILYFLLPGLIAATIFYSLTAHPKRETFDRVVQALIFTIIIKTLNIAAKKCWAYWWLPSHGGTWTDEKELVWSVINAVILGVGLSASMNWDAAHRVLRKLKITKRTSYPSEWYSGFHRYKREMVLYLKDSRRIRGWAEEYPDRADKGHFILQNICWLDDDGNGYPQPEVQATMIAAEDVYMVQFLPETLKKDLAEVEADKQKLIDFRKKKEAELKLAKKDFHDVKGNENSSEDDGE
jgi:hypothetical protein